MEEKITLETLAYFMTGSILWLTFLWGFSYIILVRKFNAVYLMFETLARGIASQHLEIAENQQNLHKNLSDQHIVLEKTIKEKEEINENDYH